MMNEAEFLPRIDLASAVPAAIAAVSEWATQRCIKEADNAADVIASGADVLWATPAAARRAEISSDQVREAIVTGLAILAQRPGGVRFGGLHWHADTCNNCPGPGSWTISESSSSRQARGAFFTPRSLAEDIVANALGVVTQPRLPSTRIADLEYLRVADISCGSGAFLVAACRYLGQQLVLAWADDKEALDEALDDYTTDDPIIAGRAHVIENCLYGVDLDPMSIELCGLALQLLAPTYQPIGGQISYLRVGDALIGKTHPDLEETTDTYPESPVRFDWPVQFPHVFTARYLDTSGFDAIIGNPPYLGGQKLSGSLGANYRKHLINVVGGGTRGSADLAAYFWLRAHELVNEMGVVAFVATNTLVQGATAQVGRDQITRQGWQIYRETQMPWPSKSAAVHCCTVWTHLRIWVPEQYRHIENDWGGVKAAAA